jgi:hypothetical protein
MKGSERSGFSPYHRGLRSPQYIYSPQAEDIQCRQDKYSHGIYYSPQCRAYTCPDLDGTLAYSNCTSGQ